jgi:hypothetical protein
VFAAPAVYEREMRNPNVRRLVVLIALSMGLWACGPSSSELTGAKAAHYKGDKMAMFNAAIAATQAKYRVEKEDQGALSFQTAGRWYTPEGLAAAESGEDMRQVPDKSLSIAYVVTLRPDGDAFILDIKPLMIRYLAGSPKPEPVNEDDPSVPGWATGKRDQLALDLHDALKQYEVASVPSGPTAAPAPAPAAPADGSATPEAPAAPSPAAPAPTPAPAPAS